MRYFFEISYNGNNYNGWQSQPNGTGVQEVVEKALTTLLRAEILIVGSGRTDTGVHCEQQYFHTDVESDVDTETLVLKLNSILPGDIAIRSIYPVPDSAHARYDAILRTYKYRIVTVKDPFASGFSWFYFKPLDLENMNRAASLILGKHDFKCFSKVKTDVNHFICSISEAYWTRTGDKMEFTITANRFLRGMVRAIVGTLLDVGTGKSTLQDFKAILSSGDRREAGQNVPPFGLYLVSVVYPETVFMPDRLKQTTK